MAWKKMLIHAWLVVAAVGATEEQEGDDVHIGSPQVSNTHGTADSQRPPSSQPAQHDR